MNKYEITVDTFDRLAEQYQTRYMDFEFYDETYRRFFDLIQLEAPEVLDVACGPGNIARAVLNRHPQARVHGIDLAPAMITLARANNPDASFDIMDTREISSIERHHDVVICGFGLPYLSKKDVATFISDAANLLKPGGLLYISTMEDEDARSGFDSNGKGDRVYIHYHQSEYLAEMLAENGFAIVEMFTKQFSTEADKPTTDLFIFARADGDGPETVS